VCHMHHVTHAPCHMHHVTHHMRPHLKHLTCCSCSTVVSGCCRAHTCHTWLQTHCVLKPCACLLLLLLCGLVSRYAAQGGGGLWGSAPPPPPHQHLPGIRQAGEQADRQAGRRAGRQVCGWAGEQAGRHVESKAGRQAGRPAGRHEKSNMTMHNCLSRKFSAMHAWLINAASPRSICHPPL
jgi:hypothetical protein